MRMPTKSGLLSWSHVSDFMGCPRRFAWKNIDKVDTHFEESPALLRGRTFHKAVELENPELPMSAPGIDEDSKILCRIAAKKYLALKENFPVPTKREIKLLNEQECFIGFGDEFYLEDTGQWMLGEMKTTTFFDPIRYALANISHQTALYKGMAEPFCSENWVSKDDFQGLFHRTILFPRIKRLKGRGKNPKAESAEEYEARAEPKVNIMHQVTTIKDEIVDDAMFNFRFIRDSIAHLGNVSNRYPKNCNSCLHPRFGVCEYIEVCQGVNVSMTDEEEGTIDYSDEP